MNAEFNWWLLIVGLVAGAALVYVVLADAGRRESELSARERPREAAWISATLRSEGVPIEPETAERVLDLHRYYLASPPPDDPDDEDDPVDEADAAWRPGDADVDGPDDATAPTRSGRRNDPDVQGD